MTLPHPEILTLARLFEHSQADLVLLFDRTGVVLYESPSVATFAGRERSGAVVLGDENSFVHPDDRADLQDKLAHILRTGIPLVVDLRICVADGTTAWVEANGVEGGETSETPSNSYTAKSALKECPGGRRIDYIMYSSGPNVTAETVYCSLPLQDRIPGKNISFSDHEAVTAKLVLKRNTEGAQISGRDFARLQSVKDLSVKLEVVDQAKDILRVSLRSVRYSRIMYLIGASLCLLLLILAFVPYGHYLALDVALFLMRLILIVIGTYLFLMSVLFFKKEGHALRGTLTSLELITERGMEEMIDVNIVNECGDV